MHDLHPFASLLHPCVTASARPGRSAAVTAPPAAPAAAAIRAGVRLSAPGARQRFRRSTPSAAMAHPRCLQPGPPRIHVHQPTQQRFRRRRARRRGGFGLASEIRQSLPAFLQATLGPEQTPGSPVELQRHPAMRLDVLADQLQRTGQVPAPTRCYRRLRVQPPPSAVIAAGSARHLQGEDIDDLHPRPGTPQPFLRRPEHQRTALQRDASSICVLVGILRRQARDGCSLLPRAHAVIRSSARACRRCSSCQSSAVSESSPTGRAKSRRGRVRPPPIFYWYWHQSWGSSAAGGG